MTSDEQDSRIGQLVLERYQVRRIVADGAMGRVYEALDMQERRHVAVKILHPDIVQDDVAVARFKREFEVSQRLPHRHIVEVLDFAPTSDQSHALVMEFLYGEELRATLKREGVLPPARLVRMLSQVALGLDEAHSQKLVHRDLKPDNLFLCQTSEGDIVKILDFGSVKDKTDSAAKLTVMGTTIGSPFYMAPEQAQGLDTLDHRADVWAMAAIGYECVTGKVPFYANSGPAILLEILTKEPALPSVAGKNQKYPVPPTLDSVFAQAFKKLPGMRIPSVGQLADQVGHAYGLTGSHRDWAAVPEAELGKLIEAQLPSVLAQVAPGHAARADVADNFFGESGALSTGQSAPPAAAPAATAERSASLIPAGVPKAGFGLALPILLGVVGLVVVVSVLFLLL